MDVCIKCGAKRGEKPFFGLLCIDCKEFKLDIPPLSVDLCKRCGRVRLGKDWVYDLTQVEESIERKIKGEHTHVHVQLPETPEELKQDKKAKVLLFYSSDKGPVQMEKWVDVNVNIVLCPECSRISGGYYEGIIQLRGNPEEVRRWASVLYRKIWQSSFVSKVEEKKEGIDLYFGSSKEALRIVREFSLPYKLSRKLYGLKEGKRVYRLTISIRF